MKIRKVKTNYIYQETNWKISTKSIKEKNIPKIVSFDGFHYQSFVTQTIPTIPAFLVTLIRVKSVIKGSVQLKSTFVV